ncbi:ABC transporter substrate-binding protein [Acidisoma silvae]|uniref:ABC transporter substrate-binding protein n=1 Tax=Acidisoma silvae TaxID=2802396 RepID=A0A963YWB5_9PROT|nr:ABC transporter substrate-binding protein [Acidisoma silvae]MCB8878065.1 ABC transporter substrate-binding protein [Acidisoma silvae]
MRKSLLAACAVVLLSAGWGETGQAAEDAIPVGVIANLTGTDVQSSLDMVHGAQAAADKINASGGIKGDKIKVIVEDSEYRPAAGIEAATKLFDVNKVSAVLVFGGSSVTLPIAEMAQPAGKIVLNTSASSAKLGDYPGTLYSTLPLDDIVGAQLGDYVAKEGVHTAVFIVPNNTFGTGLMDKAAAAFTAHGGKVLKEIAYSEGQPDYRADLQAVQRLKPDAIIGAGYGDDTRTVFRAARELGINAPWYVAYPSIFAVEDPKWMEGRLMGLDNGGLDSPLAKTLSLQATKQYGAAPRPNYYYAYDAMTLLGLAIEKEGTTAADIKKGLPEAVKGYQGATGSIDWDARGQRINPPMDYFVFRNGALQPAPAP